MKILGNIEVGGSTSSPRTALDTGAGTASGAVNDYNKAQDVLSGGGTVTWDGTNLNWTTRFICIPISQTSASSGYIDIILPASIPTANTLGSAQRVSGSGVLLNPWKHYGALTRLVVPIAPSVFFVTIYTTAFNAPSNWILIAAVNGDDGSVKLGNGEKLKSGGSFSAAGVRSFSSITLTSALPVTSGGTGTTTSTGTGSTVLSASPTLSNPIVGTQTVGDNSTKAASTAFVLGQASSTTPNVDGTAAAGSATTFARGDHVHPTDTSRAPLASPALTGTPTAPSAAGGTNTTQVATTAFVQSALSVIAGPTF